MYEAPEATWSTVFAGQDSSFSPRMTIVTSVPREPKMWLGGDRCRGCAQVRA